MTTEALGGPAQNMKPLSFAVFAWVAAFGLASFESFDTAIAIAKLLTAAGVLAAIGRALAIWLRLERKGPLALARDILLGQLTGLAYVYLRSLLSDAIGLPGMSSLECFAVAAVFCLSTRLQRPDAATEASFTLSSIATWVLWVAWLAWIAIEKLDLHYTPSSDPDIHAFYTRMLLARGHIYYDLLPQSDTWMVYPSAFMSLNFVWSVFSGLHPVQIVNIAAHIQWTLFAGATFSLLARKDRGVRVNLSLAIVHFAFVGFGFNAVFAEGRSFLEGTPRLAHTAALIHPLLLAFEHRLALRDRPALWGFPLFALALGACINPTHVPLVSLIGVASIAAVAPRERLLVPLLLALSIGALVAWTDPFYRGFLEQRSALENELAVEPDLTGHAFEGTLDLDRAVSRGLPDLWKRWSAASVEDPAARWLRRSFAILAIGGGAWFWFWRRRRVRFLTDASSGEPRAQDRSTFRFLGCLLSVALAHALWTAATPAFATPGVLQTRLLVQYSRALQEQFELMILAIVPLIALSLWLDHVKRPPPVRIVLAIAAASVGVAALLTAPQLRTSYAVLRSSPLGEVQAADVAFARRAAAQIPGDERVLLPGRTRKLPDEHWIFTLEAGRALALFSDARTSFFLGLDGWSFTADAYEHHVAPPRFDPGWLREHQVLWLFDSGQFSPQFLERHYELAQRGGRAALWRLRDDAIASAVR